MKFFKTQSKPLAWLTASLFAVLVAGCGGGGDAAPATGSGTLGVSMTDSPACGYDEVNVTVSKIRVHQSSSASESAAGWTDIELSPARKINLLDLTNGAFVSLGETPLTAGHYTQVRLVLDPNAGDGLVNSVVPTGGVETPLITPSAVQSGIKLVNQFDVADGERVDLMLDFDACKSVVKRGNGTYALKPVVKIIPFVLNGISGFVDKAALDASVLVTAQQDGVIVQTTAPNATTGAFFLGRLEPGDYDVVLTADAHATAVIAGVPVETSTSVVDLSTASAPITLPASATHDVSGTATLDPASATAVAYVTAKQTVGTAPVVTVKFVAADDTSDPAGAYALTLPSEAPLLGGYSTTLPIALEAQAGSAGMYTAEASAEGYTTQSADQNLSAADVIQDFILVP